jgi:hypothetical protein
MIAFADVSSGGQSVLVVKEAFSSLVESEGC